MVDGRPTPLLDNGQHVDDVSRISLGSHKHMSNSDLTHRDILLESVVNQYLRRPRPCSW